MSELILTILIIIGSVSLGFFTFGIVIPVSYSVGSFFSNKIECFLSRF